MDRLREFGQYGVETTVYFTLHDAADADIRYLSYVHAAGDSKVSKDGGAFANTSNAVDVTQSATGLYALTLTATEMQATRVVVAIQDQGSEAFKPLEIQVLTKLALGQIDVDATQIGGNTHAISGTGVGTGYGLNVSGASSTYYTSLFTQVEGTAPTAAIADNATIAAILQHIKRRFVNKITVSGSTLTWYQDDAASTLQSQTVSDDGSTQTLGEVS